MSAPLLGRRPKRREPKPRQCLGCGQTVASWKRLCDSCFAQLPYDRRREIAATRQTKGLHNTVELYRDAAAWLADRRAKLAGEN